MTCSQTGKYERQNVLCKGMWSGKYQNVFIHKYSPQEIENCNVEILKKRNKTQPTLNNKSAYINQFYYKYGIKFQIKKPKPLFFIKNHNLSSFHKNDMGNPAYPDISHETWYSIVPTFIHYNNR